MKPHNVVFSNDGKPKIIDFGLAVMDKGPLCESCGTAAYQAPEVANREPYRSEVDEWSWEVAHFEMLTGVVGLVISSSSCDEADSIPLPSYLSDILAPHRQTSP